MTSRAGRSSQTGDDHVHPDAWTKEDHHRYEDRVSKDIQVLEGAVEKLTTRVTLMIGAIGVLGFVIPLLAPFIRAFLNLDTPSGQ